ncbi:metalloendoproteinase 3-MMP-like [Cornus florida]|uniref:metalloendoproteinase 3-MMP-like n=1 Tax=Cornus florida TaxID=4283 RepID=UPI0028A15A0B|nr:metalloendoproteinase 3-MMP-like [Cornus florida]
MAPNLSLLLGAFLLLLVAVQSKNHTKPPEKGFKFLQHLQGCHKGQTVKGLHELKRYLEKFGYLNYGTTNNHHHSKSTATISNLNHANDDMFDDILESAVRSYQSYYHLKVTGSLDSETVQQMILPRCGVADVVNNATNMKHPRLFNMVAQYSFFPGKPRWPASKTRLTYSFQSSAQVVGLQELRSVCSRAFKKWQDVSRFTFVEAPQGADGDIVIGFHRGNHGDGYPFDGPGRTFAHAFAPTRGWFHYDADENWSSNPNMNQVDLESLAVHEIGHVLGLGHSEDLNAIMYAYFSYGTIKRDLNANDIEGIRVLYSS